MSEEPDSKIEADNNPSTEPATQETLHSLIELAQARLEPNRDEWNEAYFRTNDTTLQVNDFKRKGGIQAGTMPIQGDLEIKTLKWLHQPGYGPHENIRYKFWYVDGGKLQAQRLFEVLDSNSDIRENNEPPDQEELAQAITESASKNSVPASREQILEHTIRLFAGDPLENEMGLHVLTEQEAEELITLLKSAEETTDPYFED